MRFGDRLRAARRAVGLTQQEVADHLRIHRSTYTKYETRSVQPTFASLWKLARLVGVSVDDLLRDVEEL